VISERIGGHFWVQEWLRYATPLLLVLVEIADLIFAVDSIPALFGITTDPFVASTSHIFATLGLRARSLLPADMAGWFALFKCGLALGLSIRMGQNAAATKPGEDFRMDLAIGGGSADQTSDVLSMRQSRDVIPRVNGRTKQLFIGHVDTAGSSIQNTRLHSGNHHAIS
jgi:hypothetical protein